MYRSHFMSGGGGMNGSQHRRRSVGAPLVYTFNSSARRLPRLNGVGDYCARVVGTVFAPKGMHALSTVNGYMAIT